VITARPPFPQWMFMAVRTGSWTGPPLGKRAPRVGISSTAFGEGRKRHGLRMAQGCEAAGGAGSLSHPGDSGRRGEGWGRSVPARCCIRGRGRSRKVINYFTEMCSGSEAGSYLRLIDLVYPSTLGLRVKKKTKKVTPLRPEFRRRGEKSPLGGTRGVWGYNPV